MPRWGLLLHLYSQFHITNYFVSYICGFGQIKLASILSLKYLKWWCMDSHWHGFDSHHHQWIYFIVINLTCLYLRYMILIQLIINLITSRCFAFFRIYKVLLKSTQHNMVHQTELQSWQFNILLYCCPLLELWIVCLSVDHVCICTKFLLLDYDTINVLDVHFHFSNHQLPISEQEQLQKQLFRNEMTTIEAVKNESPPTHPPSEIPS